MSNISFVYDGTFILGGNWQHYFYNYINGSMRTYEFDNKNPSINTGDSSWSHLFGEYFYAVGGSLSDFEDELLEINLETGEMKNLLPVDPTSHFTVEERILYVAEGTQLFAYGLENEEKIRETELDSSTYSTGIAVSDDAVAVLRDRGMINRY